MYPKPYKEKKVVSKSCLSITIILLNELKKKLQLIQTSGVQQKLIYYYFVFIFTAGSCRITRATHWENVEHSDSFAGCYELYCQGIEEKQQICRYFITFGYKSQL